MSPTRTGSALLTAACAAALLLPAAAQASRVFLLEHASLGRDSVRALGEGAGVVYTEAGGRRLATRVVAPAERERWIVRLEEPGAPSFAAAVAARSARAAAFANGVTSVFAARGGARVLATFDRLLTAVVVETPPGSRARLEALPGVRRVTPDVPVRATLSRSVPQVRGDLVQRQLGGRGQGVRVGIVDTGVDYRHPALGGGFGPGFRVAGGWDFVNQDPDPIDDNGHGTHVAGIVGANGAGLVGMAPEAVFYAYKVLDQNGSGYLSTVIAAFERCADPDGDPATADALDVVNLSLGGYGAEDDDPAAEAADRLDAAGTFVVAAAGNSGALSTLGTPGIARGAITVGSVDRGDGLSYFSSRGPTVGLRLKPDVLAPGEGIVSCAPGGGSVPNSGTSMATPHVTGAVAQLRGLHPDWTHEAVRSAIVGQAKDLGRATYEQGGGRLDAFAAATATLFTSPATLSFGRVPPPPAGTVLAETLRVFGPALASEGVVLSVVTTRLPAGVTVSVAPDTIALRANDTTFAVVTVRFPGNRAMDRVPPFIVEGAVVLRHGGQTCRVPFSAHSCLLLEARLAGGVRPLSVLADGSREWPGTPLYDSRWYLPPGTYQVMGFVNRPAEPFYVQPDLALARDSLITVGAEPGGAVLAWDLRDESGLPHLPDRLDARLIHRSGAAIGMAGFTLADLARLPVANADFRLEWAATDRDRDVRYDIPGTIAGPFTAGPVRNTPAELRRQVEHVRAAAADSVFDLEYRLFPEGESGYFGLAFLDPGATPPRLGTYDVIRWIAPSPALRHVRLGRQTILAGASAARGGPGVRSTLDGPTWSLDRGDTSGVLPDFGVGPPRLRFTPRDLPLGSGFGVFRGTLAIDPGTIRLDAGQGAPFTDAVGSRLGGVAVDFTLTADGVRVDSGRLPVQPEASVPIAWSHDLSRPADWALDLIASGWTVAGRPSVTTARLRARTTPESFVMERGPDLFAVVADGGPAEAIVFGQARDPHVEWTLPYWADLRMVSLDYRRQGDAAWQPLPVTHDGEHYRAPLRECDGEIALRLRLSRDPASGSPLEIEITPAFRAIRSLAGHAALLSATADGDGARLAWRVDLTDFPLRLERSEGGAAWRDAGIALVGADGIGRFEDRTVVGGRRYSYRLAGTSDIVTLDIPAGAVAFALAVRPNPAPRDVQLALSLDRASTVRVRLFDVQGRVVLERRFAGLAPGEHVLGLAARGALGAGLYFVRVERGGDTLTRRLTLLP